MVTTPKPSGLQIRVNTDTNPLERPIQAFGSYIDKQNKMKLDDLDNKVALAKAENKSLQTVKDEQQKSLEKAQNGMYDNILTSSKIELTEFESEMANTYFDQPLMYETKMQEYVNVKLNSGIFPNTERALKYKLKAQDLTKSSLKKITKTHLTNLENASWDNITRYSGILTSKMREQIFSINDLAQLPDHLSSYSNSIIELEESLGKFVDANPQSNKSPADFQLILNQYREQHDTAMLEHVLTNMIMNPNIPQTEMLADTLYDKWQNGTLALTDDEEFEKMMNGFDKETNNVLYDLRNLLDKHTYDLHDIDTKLRIESKIKTAIKNKKSEFVAARNEMNNDMYNEMSAVKKIHVNNLSDLTMPVPSQAEITAMSMNKKGMFDPDINAQLNDMFFVKDEYMKIRDNLLDTGDVSTALNDLSNLSKMEHFTKVAGTGKIEESLYEAIFQTDTQGLNIDAPRIVSQLSLSYQDANAIIDPSVESLANNIERFGRFPQSIVNYANQLRTLTFESDVDKNALMSMAMIKVNTLGKGKVGNLDRGLDQALDEVHSLMQTHGLNFAIERFKTMVNPDFADKKIRKDLMMEYSENVFKQSDLQEKFSDKIKSAVGRNNLLDPPFYVYGLVDIGRYALGMESIRGERNLDNILKYKTTFLFGTAKNMSMENSAYQVFQEIYENNVGDYLTTNTPTEKQMAIAMDDAFIASIKEMSEQNYEWSYMLYNPDQPYGLTLTKMSPEAMTGLNTQTLALNATNFAYKHIQKLDPNDVALQFFDTPLNATNMDDYNEFQREFFQLAENGKLKLVPNTTTLDRENQEWFINIQKEDGSWGLLMDGVNPASWKPNTNFTDEVLPYGKDGIYNEVISEQLNELNINDPALKEEVRKSLEFAFKAQDKYAEIGDWFQATFPTWGSDNFRKDDDVDTLTEKITSMASKYEEKVVEKQQELDFQFKDEIEEQTLRHRSRYDQTIPSDLDEIGALNYLKDKNTKLIETYNNTFNNIGVVIHPRHQFVIQDIIDAVGLEAVGEGSAFYLYLQNEQYRYARDYIDKLAPKFKNKQRHKELLTLWGVQPNVQSR